jgi:hypothetical protein
MAGPDPAIHVDGYDSADFVDARNKSGHDD